MSAANFLLLVILSAIWGASFLFLRIAVPHLGPVLLIESRVLLAALFLSLVALFLRRSLLLRTHWRHFLFLGLFNSALPFVLIAFAAQSLSVSLLSVLNATPPMWGVLIAAIWLKQRPKIKVLIGLMLGVLGVYILLGKESTPSENIGAFPVVAVLLAAFFYGLSSVYAHTAQKVEPFANAHGSLWAAALLLMPVWFVGVPAEITLNSQLLWAVIALGVLCSGVAYLMYFHLIAQIGAASALTVTYLIPVFGILWGYLILDEAIGWHTLLGAVTVLIGTALVTGFSLRAVFRE